MNISENRRGADSLWPRSLADLGVRQAARIQFFLDFVGRHRHRSIFVDNGNGYGNGVI